MRTSLPQCVPTGKHAWRPFPKCLTDSLLFIVSCSFMMVQPAECNRKTIPLRWKCRLDPAEMVVFFDLTLRPSFKRRGMGRGRIDRYARFLHSTPLEPAADLETFSLIDVEHGFRDPMELVKDGFAQACRNILRQCRWSRPPSYRFFPYLFYLVDHCFCDKRIGTADRFDSVFERSRSLSISAVLISPTWEVKAEIFTPYLLKEFLLWPSADHRRNVERANALPPPLWSGSVFHIIV